MATTFFFATCPYFRQVDLMKVIKTPSDKVQGAFQMREGISSDIGKVLFGALARG
jgi:hypothetical protein